MVACVAGLIALGMILGGLLLTASGRRARRGSARGRATGGAGRTPAAAVVMTHRPVPVRPHAT